MWGSRETIKSSYGFLGMGGGDLLGLFAIVSLNVINNTDNNKTAMMTKYSIIGLPIMPVRWRH